MEGMGNRSPSPSSSSGEELPDFSQVLNGTHRNTNNHDTDAQVPDRTNSLPLHVPLYIAERSPVVNRNGHSPSTDSANSLPSYENVLNRTQHSPSIPHEPSGSEAQRSAGAQNQEQGERSTTGVRNRSGVQSTLDSFRLPPVMPNLADQALQRLKEKESSKVDEEDEFQPTKKRRVEDAGTEEEGQQCSICFESWSNSGTHRISTLKCGHLFGQKCIEKWLKNTPKCPQCNAKAKPSDIRVIYAKAISVVDTTGRDRALQDLENEKNVRISAQKAEAQAVLQYQLARAECDRLKEEIKTLKEQLERYSNAVKCEGDVGSDAGGSVECVGVSHDRQGKYELYKSISLSQNGSCRVLGYDPNQHMLVATRPSNNALFPGYGLCKISTVDLQHCEYVPIHSATGVIRDVAFSPRGDGMVLTASTDKSIKLTSMQSNSVVLSFQTTHPVWACTWDQDQPYFLYCGLQNGVVQTYDTRNTAGHVEESKRPTGGACPITSLTYVPLCRAGSLSCGGVLMGTLGGCVFWEKSNDKLVHHPLTSLPEGACTSLTFDPITRHCFSSFRPCRGTPYTRHTLFNLRKDSVENKVFCQAVNEFKGGYTHKLLSRSHLIDRPSQDGRLLAAFGDEATKSAQIWDVSSSRKLQQLSLIKEPALDMLSFGSDPEASFLSLLTNSKLFVYKWAWQ